MDWLKEEQRKLWQKVADEVAQRQPEGKIKDECREIAKAEGLIFWQIEGKGRKGVPDTLAGRVAGRCMLIEFKVPGKEPEEQQWLRIYELREQGQEAWWCDSVEGYRRLVGLDPGGYKIVYTARAKRAIGLDDPFPKMEQFIKGMKIGRPSRGTGA